MSRHLPTGPSGVVTESLGLGSMEDAVLGLTD